MTYRPFERPATISLPAQADEGGFVLEGLYVAGPDADVAGAVVAPPHPLYGGSMEHPVVTEIAQACAKAEMSVLRFNWRGVGASGGDSSGESTAAREDYLASLAFVEESVSGVITACGYSYGAVTAVLAAAESPRVRRLLLVAPPASMLDLERLSAFPGPVFIGVGEQDELASASELERMTESLHRGCFVPFPETDHFFQRSVPELGRAAYRWLSR